MFQLDGESLALVLQLMHALPNNVVLTKMFLEHTDASRVDANANRLVVVFGTEERHTIQGQVTTRDQEAQLSFWWSFSLLVFVELNDFGFELFCEVGNDVEGSQSLRVVFVVGKITELSLSN